MKGYVKIVGVQRDGGTKGGRDEGTKGRRDEGTERGRDGLDISDELLINTKIY